jgi:hypothetical protein
MPTLWQARQAGWTVTLKCHRQREGLKSVKPCAGELKVHLGTLVAALGPELDLAELQTRLRCPTCGTDRVEIRTIQPPAAASGVKDEQQVRRRMRPPQTGEATLGKSREPWIVMTCNKCGRRGEYRRVKLIEEFGTEIDFPSLLAVFAHSRGCALAIPHPTQLDLTRPKECLIHFDVEG